MIAANFIQYLRPNGKTKFVTIDVEDALSVQLEQISAAGLTLTCEELMSEVVSLTISTDEDDYDIELEQNGPGIPAAVDRLIRRFDTASYEAWRDNECDDAEQPGGE